MVAPAPPPAPHHPDIDRVLNHAVAQKVCSGAAAMLSMPMPNGALSVVHRATYGRSQFDVYEGRALTRDSLFDVGELCFSLGPVMLTLLWTAAGKMDVRRALSVFLPETSQGPLANIPLTQLLDQTSGLVLTPELVARIKGMAPAPPRPRHHAVDEKVAPRALWRSAFSDDLPAPTDEATRAKIRSLLLMQAPVSAPGTAVHNSALNGIVLGFVLEAIGKKPLHELLEREVFQKLHVSSGFAMPRNSLTGLHPRKIGSQAFGPVAATLDCPWRHRMLVGETSDPLAWLWGGLMGHSGLFATIDGVHALLINLLESHLGRSSVIHAGTLKRFWTRSQQIAQPTTTLGFVVPCRDNGLHQSRWPQQSVGQIAQEGAAFFVDLMGGTLGVVLTNLTHPTAADKQSAWAHLRLRTFDAMAMVADELRRRPPKARPAQRPKPRPQAPSPRGPVRTAPPPKKS